MKTKLNRLIKERNMTQRGVAMELGISLSRMNAKINGRRGAQFLQWELKRLKEILALTPQQMDELFFV